MTWDSGATDYLASLFFPVFVALRAHGVEVHTLQGTWGTAQEVERLATHAESLGLPFHALRFSAKHRRVRMGEYILRFAEGIQRYARQHAVDVVMPRALIPGAATVLAYPLLRGCRIVWDADGLPADERVDFAGWSARGLPYRALRRVERGMLRIADATMVRTARAAEILAARAGNARPEISVVPNGRDAQAFQPSSAMRATLRSQEGIPADAPLLISVGSLGPQYYPQTQAEIVAALHRQHPEARAVFLTAQQTAITAALASAGADPARVLVRRVPAEEVPLWLSAADVGLALRAPAFSQQAVCPLKVGEYLLSGLPVVATRGVGDLDRQLEGVPSLLVEDALTLDRDATAAWILAHAPVDEEVQQHCRQAGLRYFSLQAAVDGYLALLAVA